MMDENMAELMVLSDDEGNEHEFEIIGTLEKDGHEYYALLPVFDEPEELIEDEGVYYIFESIGVDGEEELQEVEDEELLDQLAAEFESKFADFFEPEAEE